MFKGQNLEERDRSPAPMKIALRDWRIVHRGILIVMNYEQKKLSGLYFTQVRTAISQLNDTFPPSHYP